MEKRLGEDEIKYVREVPAELPKIDSIRETQVKSPDIITKTTEMDMERAKLEDKSMIPGEVVKPESKIPSTPIPYSIEAPAEADLAKEETAAEPPTMVSLETPRVQKTEADVETAKPVNGEKLIAEKDEREEEEMIPVRAERIEVIMEPEIKEPLIPFAHLEETPAETDLKEEIAPVEPSEAVPTAPLGVQQIEVDDDMMKLTREERLMVERAERKEEETVAERAERIEIQVKPEVKEPPVTHFEDVPAEADLKEEVTAEPSRPMEPSKPIEPLQIQQMEADDDVTKPVDEKPLVRQVERKDEEEEEVIPEYAERIKVEIQELPKEEAEQPPAEIVEMEAAPSVTIKKETEPADAEEVEKLTVDEVLPEVDLVEVEEVKPSELPIAEVEVIEAIEQPVLEAEITKARDEEVVERVTPPVTPREEEAEKLPSIEKAELPAEVPTLPELTAKVKREEAVLLERKFHVFEAFEVEEKILIVKAKPSEAAEVPVEPQPPAKPHFVLDRRTKFEERELLHVIAEATKPLPPPTTTTVSRSVTCRAVSKVIRASQFLLDKLRAL